VIKTLSAVNMSEHNYLAMRGDQEVSESHNMTGEVLDDTFDDDIIWDMPPGGNVEVDQTPLQLMIKKNKESLQKKLLARRPMETLVEQGIVPGYKTNPSLHMQKTKLERAKMGDMLRSKISHRPERAELVHRHILEDARPDIDPSLCDRQRQLKRAKLADSLAVQLSQRPGPLELIQKNILHTNDPVEQAVKQGAIPFRPTADGSSCQLSPFPYDEDSSDTAPSPLVDVSVESPYPSELPSPSPSVPTLIAQFTDASPKVKSVRSESLGDINVIQHISNLDQQLFGKMTRSDSFGGSGENHSLPSSSSISSGIFSRPNLQRDAPGKERKKLKSKSKPMPAPKPRTIKFHEYKGPELSSKRKNSQKRKSDKSTYDLLLEQQQLILQWQLDNKHKFPQILLPAKNKMDASERASIMSLCTSSTSGYVSGTSSSQASSLVNSPANSIPGTPRSTTPRSSTPTRSTILTPQDVNNATSLLNKMDGMKVNDLKVELKKRNLPVSGSKPLLIERLRPFLQAIIAAGKIQFKEPYKQIPIPNGGLIILKPSPNSQLLSNPQANGDTHLEPSLSPGTPQGMHEGTPELDDNTMQGRITPFSPMGMLSPKESIHENSHGEDAFQERRMSAHSNMDVELNLNYMEIEQHAFLQTQFPPPPPPPPPSVRAVIKLEPTPLPPPPALQINLKDSSPHQFLPSQQPSQQINWAKAQLEAQLSSSQTNMVSQPSNTTRAGPKGQFIWPPVSVQSSQGTVITIRASQNSTTPNVSCTTTSTEQPSISETIMSSKPFAQLAAVFSQPSSSSTQRTQQSPLLVQLPSEPVPASELGITLPSNFNYRKAAGSHISAFNDVFDKTSNEEQLYSNSNSVPFYQLPKAELPTTLPSVHLADVKEEADNADIKENNIMIEMAQSPNDIIKQQQMQIQELQKALQKSQQQLITQQPSLTCEPSGISKRNNSNLSQVATQHVQNTQLARQINEPLSVKNNMERLSNSLKLQGERENQHVSELLDYGPSESMDDVIDILMKNGDLPEKRKKIESCKPPSPPPLPVKNNQMEFPQLDFSDISFDFGETPTIQEMLSQSQQNQNQVNSMEVDMHMDVQDWLDSLVVPLNKMDPE